MFMRRRRPLVRAAMVGGGAYYAGKRVQQGREAEAEQEARIAELESRQQVQAAPAPPPSAGISNDPIARLEKLDELRKQGILTEDEFAQQKQKLLGAT